MVELTGLTIGLVGVASLEETDQFQREKLQRGELQFLNFPLSVDTSAMLPVSQLSEVLTLSPAQVVPIPDMEPWVLGIYNWRGEILWIIDLSHLLGLQPLQQESSSFSAYKVMVAQGQHSGSQLPLHLGLAVRDVEDMHWCNPSDIASAPTAAITPGLAPFLRGYTLGSDREMLMALDTTPIFERLGIDALKDKLFLF